MKRAFDFILVLFLLALFWPVLIIICFVVFFFIDRSIIFRQTRVGKNGNLFEIYKFRTMFNSTDKTGVLLPDHLRTSKLGKFLRSTSLDELPELINVLRGDMSLVGPRPLLVQYLHHYSVHQARRHEVRPGITGWAQVNGRNAISWEDKFELDVWYVDNRSLLLDIKILLLTSIYVIKRSDINATDKVTMPFFTGSKKNGNPNENNL